MRWNSFDQNKDTQNTMNNTQQHISLSKQIYQKSKQEICWTLEPISVMLCMFSCLVGSTVATVKQLIGYQPCSASFISKWQSIHVSLISLTKTYAVPPGPWRAWPALRFGPGPQKTSIYDTDKQLCTKNKSCNGNISNKKHVEEVWCFSRGVRHEDLLDTTCRGPQRYPDSTWKLFSSCILFACCGLTLSYFVCLLVHILCVSLFFYVSGFLMFYGVVFLFFHKAINFSTIAFLGEAGAQRRSAAAVGGRTNSGVVLQNGSIQIPTVPNLTKSLNLVAVQEAHA